MSNKIEQTELSVRFVRDFRCRWIEWAVRVEELTEDEAFAISVWVTAVKEDDKTMTEKMLTKALYKMVVFHKLVTPILESVISDLAVGVSFEELTRMPENLREDALKKVKAVLNKEDNAEAHQTNPETR